MERRIILGEVCGKDKQGNAVIKHAQGDRRIVLYGSYARAVPYTDGLLIEYDEAYEYRGEWHTDCYYAKDRRREFDLSGNTRLDMVLFDEQTRDVLAVGMWEHPERVMNEKALKGGFKSVMEGRIMDSMYLLCWPLRGEGAEPQKNIDDAIIRAQFKLAPKKIIQGEFPAAKTPGMFASPYTSDGTPYHTGSLLEAVYQSRDAYPLCLDKMAVEDLIRKHLPQPF